MKINYLRKIILPLQLLVLAGLAIGTMKGMETLTGSQSVHALPEYTPRTGEPCSACHVSAGGGGPQTMSGLLWAARGRPDQLPELPGMLLAPGLTDGGELYDLACAGCHGINGEGASAMGLANQEMSRASMRDFIVDGIPELDMPGFEGQFTDEQLELLTDYAIAIGRGEIAPAEYLLPTPAFRCEAMSEAECGEQ